MVKELHGCNDLPPVTLNINSLDVAMLLDVM